ncbi:MAG: KpsF/GutQ family sugar-phosphate isomerase [Candidatus Nealsonbacteria bacterium]|nr:KpsF/GutQ family sugar-phosphate isomerase [Candidatus Nealsonbacteria bacterium]
MDAAAAKSAGQLSPFGQLRYARDIIHQESRSLLDVAKRLDGEFCRAVDLLFTCRGSVIVSGMGKAGLVGQKIMATLASTGTAAHCLHPAEAVHGDLGRVTRHDVMLMLSQSGETDEVVRLLPSLRGMRVPIVAITARADSTLGTAATVAVELGSLQEACPLGLAPSTSTTAMLAVGDALALVVSRMRNFGREDFARFHPAGSLGVKLSKVEEHMRPLAQCRVAGGGRTIRDVLVGASIPGRRTGAIMLVDDAGCLSGIFTDSDLARLFERRRDGDLDAPARNVMTANPLSVTLGSLMTDAVTLMVGRKISELPVVDANGQPVGLIDVTDVVGLLPKESVAGPTDEASAVDLPTACRVFREPEERSGA